MLTNIFSFPIKKLYFLRKHFRSRSRGDAVHNYICYKRKIYCNFVFFKVCNIAHVLNERTKNIFSKKKKEKEILFVSPSKKEKEKRKSTEQDNLMDHVNIRFPLPV